VAVEDLKAIAAKVGTAPLRASAGFAEGVVTAAAGDHETARRLFEDATDVYGRCEAPFETGRCQIELASCLRATGRLGAATEQARRAARTLADLGAEAEAARASSLVRELAATASGGPPPPLAQSVLTRRQLDVLGLVAEGLSDREVDSAGALRAHRAPTHRQHLDEIRGADAGSRRGAGEAARSVVTGRMACSGHAWAPLELAGTSEAERMPLSSRWSKGAERKAPNTVGDAADAGFGKGRPRHGTRAW
jgi:ATP/maltotriose-dependent transcriptional regulator MalT